MVESFQPNITDLVVDAGAHVGLYTFYASTRSRKVIAFEPIPLNFFYLINHIKLNKLNNVIALPIAVGNKKGIANFYIAGYGFGGSTLFKKHAEVVKGHFPIMGTVKAKVTTLDSVIQVLGIKTIDLLKIDAEGAEELILLGAKSLMERGNVRRVVVEVYKTINKLCAIIELLKNYGYKINKIFEESEKAFLYASFER